MQPHPQTDLYSWCVKAFIPMNAAIAGRSLFYMGQGNPGTLCGPHSGLPHVCSAVEICVILNYRLTCVILTFETNSSSRVDDVGKRYEKILITV